MTGWKLVDPSGATRIAFAAPLADGANESLGRAAQKALLTEPARTTAHLAQMQDINLVVELTPTCTAADKAIQPRVVIDVRLDDGTTTRQTIAPLEATCSPRSAARAGSRRRSRRSAATDPLVDRRGGPFRRSGAGAVGIRRREVPGCG